MPKVPRPALPEELVEALDLAAACDSMLETLDPLKKMGPELREFTYSTFMAGASILWGMQQVIGSTLSKDMPAMALAAKYLHAQVEAHMGEDIPTQPPPPPTFGGRN